MVAALSRKLPMTRAAEQQRRRQVPTSDRPAIRLTLVLVAAKAHSGTRKLVGSQNPGKPWCTQRVTIHIWQL